MKHNSMKKMLSVIWCIVLIAALALSITGCGSSSTPEATASGGTIHYTVVTVDLEGKETTFEITTDKTMVGEALMEEGILAGEQGDYGLYIKTVNGLTLDWDKDAKYWAFYIDGEYALTGVDLTEAAEGAVYTFKPES